MAETEKRNSRKVVTGTVVSISGDKSITVKIDYRKRHPKYGKMMTISKKLHAHDEKNECGIGDLVTVRPRYRHGDPPAVQDQALASRGDRRARQVSISDESPDVRRACGRTSRGIVRRNTNDSDGDHAQRR